jgi:methylenetetrahydrofolate dehydrogenase (NADP+)/methenyltetrahydrofolate cyclohydrolase
MTAQIIDGKLHAHKIKNHLKSEVGRRTEQGHRAPGLAVVQVGHDPASTLYVQHKRKACSYVGFASFSHDFPENIAEDTLLDLIQALNEDPLVDGILVQLPLPKTMNTTKVIESIVPHKDVDGFHPYNIGCLTQKRPLMRSCTPKGIMCLIRSTGCEVEGMHAVVVGASNIVGRPMMLELLLAGATVTICHKKTTNLRDHVAQADILVVGIGQPCFIKGDWIKENAVVIDVGINQQPDGCLKGDVAFDEAKHKASFITPVPGGVGPMTIASLLENTYQAYELSNSLHTE